MLTLIIETYRFSFYKYVWESQFQIIKKYKSPCQRLKRDINMTKAVLINPVPRPSIMANSAEIEQIDLSDLEYSIGEALETPTLDALGVFEGFSLFEYSPFDELGE